MMFKFAMKCYQIYENNLGTSVKRTTNCAIDYNCLTLNRVRTVNPLLYVATFN